MKQIISSRLTQLGSNSETFCTFLRNGIMVSIILALTVRRVCDDYKRWEAIQAIFIAAYVCN